MSAALALAREPDLPYRIVDEPNGTHFAVWGPFLLRSAFQPLFRFRNGKLAIAGVEGLIRPMLNGAPVMPGSFFRSIERHELRMVETLCRTLHILNATKFRRDRIKLFLNFDPSALADKARFAETLSGIGADLRAAGLKPSSVVCEITEHRASSEADLKHFVYLLRAEGYQVAIDDFGAKSSDLGRVEALTPDIVKFDGRWATRLMDTRAGYGLLKLMVTWFADRGIPSVIEGVETRWQLELSEACGAAYVQGFGLARPQTVPVDFRAFLDSAREITDWPDEPVRVPDRARRFG